MRGFLGKRLDIDLQKIELQKLVCSTNYFGYLELQRFLLKKRGFPSVSHHPLYLIFFHSRTCILALIYVKSPLFIAEAISYVFLG